MSAVAILHPLVRRLTAPNASAYTFTGTQTYLVGRGEVAVIDPGPADGPHVAAILAAAAGERIVAIVCTHTHRDHSPAAALLKAATGAAIVGCAALVPAAGADGGVDAAYDLEYAPDRVLADGDEVAGEGWTLRALATPGHTSNHLCYALPEADALFSGDHVMGWSTSIVSPPDGDMGAYMASLERLVGRDELVYWPGHGEPVDRPQRLVRGMLGHRKQREGQILRRLGDTPATIAELVATMYAGLDEKLRGAAARSVLAHLVDLERRGMVIGGETWARTV
ncbi:MBL fold metallo-hydrolase [Sphingomonas prati]|uniref:Glyoxylase-like metal-dependent hydrolase (Beta-lactamase superfamily II) n=1 Tax=Sphingomonas prati TaxID=1843237 RepID=A0A7W9BT72_9SPHN|nr:MBL fold metallo-hydrolase [Sphingomonas prati]MBB5729158.1 glyoxylase-like metal-dependent hydrolase (beta-lactamase superfamily II) [Sphingomonas prati]GGE84651.1 MBL fold metallo-hydrolase [Sphingomonas prati]